MTKIRQSDLARVSFPDCRVTQFKISESCFKCVLDGIHIENQGLIETTVLLSISDWHEAVVKRFDGIANNLIVLPINEVGELIDICECDLNPNHASLAGFERYSGLWQTVMFKKNNHFDRINFR